MYDNRIISNSKYNVTSVDRITVTDNNLTKRSYTTNAPVSNSKKQSDSDSFNHTLKSTISHTSSTDDSKIFSNELENTLRLKSEENARLVQAKFNQNTLNDSNSNKSITETEFHNKLSEAMGVEVDTSTLCKKIELLHSLKNES
jgi:flagellar hook-basal body complex protein FliE